MNDLAAVLFVQLLPFDRVRLHKSFRDAIYGPYRARAEVGHSAATRREALSGGGAEVATTEACARISSYRG